MAVTAAAATWEGSRGAAVSVTVMLTGGLPSTGAVRPVGRPRPRMHRARPAGVGGAGGGAGRGRGRTAGQSRFSKQDLQFSGCGSSLSQSL
ncbi:hypothetical protein GCM10009760_53050 [Kitasatospora kazusensis]|uniref:Uncharacterized protein n=1 Tax=Kitasatospora kazusensis TaxID=407974 RepID=A0ABN3A639_9ACTN